MIMNEWKEYKYGDIISIKSEKLNPIDSSNIKCIELEHISQGYGVILGSVDISEQKSMKNRFYKGQVLFGKLRPYLKKYARPDFSGACSTEIWVMDSKTEKLSNDFLYLIVQSKQFMDLANNSTGSKMPRADWNYIKDKSVSIPSIKEQKKITEMISIWDESINLKNKLIIQKSKFLSNLALSLQKNKKSIVNFKTSWETIRLSSVFSERKEFGYESDGLKLYSLTIEDGVTAKTDRYNREFLIKGDKKKYKVTKYQDLVFNPQNLRYGAIALNNIQKPVLLSPIYTTLEIKDNERYDIEYFNFLLTSDEMIKYYDSIAEGTLVERMKVKPEIFLKQEFNIPPIEEQRLISKLLTGLRKEINLLRNELEFMKLQKQGLMQQLLTGKIRVSLN
jgi:type I restriction enzyme S subunit